MPVPSAITDLSQTAGSNYPSGGESPITADNYFQAYASFIALLRDGKGHSTQTTLASATATDIGGQNSLYVSVTGTTTITGFGTNYNGPRFVSFTGALILTHSATLVIPGAANITTAANDSCIAIPISGGWKIVSYDKYSGLPTSTTGLAASGANNDITSLTALTAGGLPNNSVLTADIADANITTIKILDSNVTTAKIADANVTAAKLSGAQTGSAPVYGIRAWINFNGTGTAAVKGSGNATLTDNGTGDYTVTFTTAMPDANYSVSFGLGTDVTGAGCAVNVMSQLAGSIRFEVFRWNGSTIGTKTDLENISVTIVR